MTIAAAKKASGESKVLTQEQQIAKYRAMDSKVLIAHLNEGCEQVTKSRAIRKLLKLGIKQSKIAKMLDVRDQMVSQVKRDRFYKGD